MRQINVPVTTEKWNKIKGEDYIKIRSADKASDVINDVEEDSNRVNNIGVEKKMDQ